MGIKHGICLLQAILCFCVVSIAYFFVPNEWKWVWMTWGGILGISYMVMAVKPAKEEEFKDSVNPSGKITELILLSEEDTELTHWNLYGKTGLVIGRDVGENQVTINLSEATYASMIEIEHAVLNYSGSDWYIEDLSSKNGVSIEKSDGKKYKLASLQPCKLEKGDILYIAMTRLLVW